MADDPPAPDPDLSPLDFMLQVMRDPTATRSERIDMAKAAAPYFHGRIGAPGSKGKADEAPPPLLVRMIERRVIDPDPADP
ncbi:hypothetical protein QO010_000368 [Caulobacter ginsengisoli]|uniref:Uncharacterized protein n=1 Tax=Caulobacter ginsengisoli TaxID=400775 RepID=A0ABU0IKT2_9CAUL|nr:hypothetical protein [Caulobacter ginsengisoli]MDQ0462620.1 hypothetical protein [Caulobacter ginsengisoli]